MSEISKLHFYSIGIVAENKKLSTRLCEIVPIEDMSFFNGELTTNIEKYKAKASDTSGAAYQLELDITTSIQAEWLPINGSNRVTAPDVRRGETVILYRFADQDKFWWSTLKDDLRLRKLETVIYAFSATQNEGDDCKADNTYFLEISTHNKTVTFHTSSANGEPFEYDIQINTGEGFIKIQDDVGNYVYFNSVDNQIRINNKAGSFLDIKQDNITMTAISKITLNAPDVVVNAPSTFTVNSPKAKFNK